LELDSQQPAILRRSIAHAARRVTPNELPLPTGLLRIVTNALPILPP